jgi:methyl-accepting chemotaxis protein
VQENADHVRAIATASEEQSATSEEINRAVEEINRVSGETATGMQEAARSIHELSDQAGRLEQLVAQLRHDEQNAA